MSKRTLIVLILTILLITSGVALWYFFFRGVEVDIPTDTPSGESPFGEGGGSVPPPTSTDGESGSGGVSGDGSITPGSEAGRSALFQISDTPVAGFVAFVSRANAPTMVRYVDRATGHIYDVNPFTSEKIKIANNTLPKIVEAHFKKDASSVLLRTVDEDSVVENISLALTAPKSTTTDALYEVKATILNGDMKDVSVGPTNMLAFVLSNNDSISTANFDGTKVTQAFSSPFTDWRIRWGNANTITLTTKASASVPGFTYNLGVPGGRLFKVLGPLNGLTALVSPDDKRVVFSYNSSGQTVFSSQNISTGERIGILPATFADKCVWSIKNIGLVYCGAPKGIVSSTEPDNWYKGISHFSDEIWGFNTITTTSEFISDPSNNSDLEIDVLNPALSPSEDYLFFMNKNDLSLWALKLI